MHFDEQRVDPHRHRRARQRLDELRLAAACVPAAPGSWTLCVASKTTGQPNSRMIAKAAHVHHQIVVAERRAALGQQDLRIAGGRDLVRGVPDILRRDELALLDIDDPARPPGLDQQIRLAAEERRNLQNVARPRAAASACDGS